MSEKSTIQALEQRVRDLEAEIARIKNTEKKLRISEELFRLAFRTSPDSINLNRASDGMYIDINEGFTKIMGYTRDEVIGKSSMELNIWEDSNDRKRLVNGLSAAGYVENLEAGFVGKDGTGKIGLMSARILNANEEAVILSVTRDITDRKRAEEALRESEERLKFILDGSQLGTWDWDIDTGEVKRNARWAEMIGYTLPEIEHSVSQCTNLIHPDDRAAARQSIQDHLAGKTPMHEIEYRMCAKDGQYKWILDRSKVVKRDSKGRPIRMSGTHADTTNIKQAEADRLKLERQIQQTQKLESLGVLAGGIAHDFNNILMAVLGHAELALDEISPMSAARESILQITIAARRAAELCRQMVAYSGRATFTLEKVNLRELIEEMAHLLKTSISKKAVLNLSLERGLPAIHVDASQVRQIVMNLIINASEAVDDRSGVITVAAGATRCDVDYLTKTELHDSLTPGLYVHLEVTDTGCGMDAETRGRIFEPFFTTKFTGRGLGLAAVLGIVRAHKGAIKVYSEPGKGTTFKVLFPALEVEEKTVSSRVPSPSDNWQGKGTILLADDEESLRALGAVMLERLGFTVLTAVDGRDALELFRKRQSEICLVVLDLTMPHMDGAQAFGELRRINPDIRVILASGYSQEDVAARFAGKRLSGVLQKPYSLGKLRELLMKVSMT
ncbi:MAG: PAS domain S-box protein [Deltaproteobacteria bacterium]|nr:PAS domain S-box protein [Deltaproteobacteria bacterium]